MNITKSFYLAVCIAVGGSFAASCDDDRNEVRYDVIQVPDQLFADGMTADATGGSQTFLVKSPATVSVQVEKMSENDDLKWIKAEVGDCTADGYPVTVTTELNETRGPRSARVSVFAGNVARGMVVTQPTSAPVVAPETPINNVSATEIAKSIFAGVNIGNTLEAPDGEGSWCRPVTVSYIRGLKAAGFNAVRIPCAWNSHIQGKTTAEKAKNIIDPAWLDRVDEIVGWVIGEGMYAIVNIHWDGGWLEESCVNGYDADVDKKQSTFWTQIANKLGHYDEHLLFAGMNEPGQQNQTQAGQEQSVKAIMAYQQTFVNAVRGTGGNNASRVLIHQTPFTNIDEGIRGLYKLPEDPAADRSMVEVHFYDPSDFTIMEKDGDWSPTVKLYWGKDNFVEGSDRNCTWGDESHVDAQFAKIQNYYVSKGIPAIIGEYGVEANRNINGMDVDKHLASRAYWTEYVTMSAKKHGCVPFLWETGNDINRTDGILTNAYLFNALMNGAANGIYPF